GRGGMGIVYEAEHEALGRQVALKVLPRTAAGDAHCLLRFRREARAAARLHHTNIVPVFDIGERDGVHFYAMQFIPGQGLDVVLAELGRLRGELRQGDGDAGKSLASSRKDSPSLAASLAGGLLASSPPQAVEGAVCLSPAGDPRTDVDPRKDAASSTGGSSS